MNIDIIDNKKIYTGRIFSLEKETLSIDNQIIEMDLIQHPGAVVILPLTDHNSFLLVKQYRHAIGSYCLEFPAGTLETNEEVLTCAQREIQEEVGYNGKSWKELGFLHTTPGFCNEKIWGFLTYDLYPSKLPQDDEEDIEVIDIPIPKLIKMVEDQELTDSKTISFLYKYLLSNN
jgi:ADP-ribose pyrophosphatase